DELERTANSFKDSQQEISDLKTVHARLEGELEQVRQQAEDKLSLLLDAKDQMTSEFKLLAENVMKQHGESFKKQKMEQIGGILAPLRDKLVEFQQGLQTAHTDSVKERATLVEQIRALAEASTRMNSETQSLTRALRGRPQTQGVWGEMILNTILDRSGLRE